MNYIITIKSAIFTFPFIALLFTIPFILHQYHKYGSINKFRIFIVYSFILYMITIYFLVILPLPNKENVINNTNMIRLIPFSFVGDFIKETSLVINDSTTYLKALCEPCVYIVIFNIFMTMPFGMYLRYYFKCNLKKTVIIGFALSLFFELTQLTGLYFIYPKPYRLFDVDDLMLNTFGAVLGYIIMGLFIKYLPTRDMIDEDSFEKGKEVSGLRRITTFCLDICIFALISFDLYICFQNIILVCLTFIIYYLLIPLITKGQTIGGKFLNIKIIYTGKFILKTIIRNIFINVYYISIPIIIVYLMDYIVHNNFVMLIYASLFLMLILFYPLHIIPILKGKQIYYDKLFKPLYFSTIKERKEEI